MHFGILVFPGTNCEHDTLHVVQNVLGETGALVWHSETDVSAFDALILPGGFAHGDYLRTGAVARFSPVMDAVAEFAAAGKPVLGICNGFQILCEAGLLPGALRRNKGSHFICKDVYLRVESNKNLFLQHTNPNDILRMPIRHGEGSYYADDETLAELNRNGQVLVRYANEDGSVNSLSDPNGSSENIAGVSNERGNVFGLMPHPEAASEAILGNADGLTIFHGIVTGRDRSQARSNDSGLLNATSIASV